MPSNNKCVLSILLVFILISISNSDNSSYCGRSYNDANSKCSQACPDGGGCPSGEACFLDTKCPGDSGGGGSGGSSGGASVLTNLFGGSSSSSSSQSGAGGGGDGPLAGVTGAAAVEATFQQMKDAINEKLFLYETPDEEWVPSTVYRFDGFFDGLKIMHTQGVAGKKVYLGGECEKCHMYGLVNIAAFLAQVSRMYKSVSLFDDGDLLAGAMIYMQSCWRS